MRRDIAARLSCPACFSDLRRAARTPFLAREISELYADAGFGAPRIPNAFPFWHAWGRKRPRAAPASTS